MYFFPPGGPCSLPIPVKFLFIEWVNSPSTCLGSSIQYFREAVKNIQRGGGGGGGAILPLFGFGGIHWSCWKWGTGIQQGSLENWGMYNRDRLKWDGICIWRLKACMFWHLHEVGVMCYFIKYYWSRRLLILTGVFSNILDLKFDWLRWNLYFSSNFTKVGFNNLRGKLDFKLFSFIQILLGSR